MATRLEHGAVTVTDTATEINSGEGGRSLSIYNNGAVTVFVGKSDVTAANGMPIPAGAERQIETDKDDIYGIVASGTAEVRYWLEVY